MRLIDKLRARIDAFYTDFLGAKGSDDQDSDEDTKKAKKGLKEKLEKGGNDQTQNNEIHPDPAENHPKEPQEGKRIDPRPILDNLMAIIRSTLEDLGKTEETTKNSQIKKLCQSLINKSSELQKLENQISDLTGNHPEP